MLFPVRDEEHRPVLPLTAYRCVFCGAKIAPITVLVRAALRSFCSKHSSVIADTVQVRVMRRTESRA
jgi:hypothetical protein